MTDEEYQEYHNYKELKKDYDVLKNNFDAASNTIKQMQGIIKSYLPQYNLCYRTCPTNYRTGEWYLVKIE